MPYTEHDKKYYLPVVVKQCGWLKIISPCMQVFASLGGGEFRKTFAIKVHIIIWSTITRMPIVLGTF